MLRRVEDGLIYANHLDEYNLYDNEVVLFSIIGVRVKLIIVNDMLWNIYG